MSHPSKQKGNRFETLIVKMTKDLDVPARRAWGSNGQALGMHEEVDVLINEDIKVQAKVRKKIAEWIMPDENVDIQVIKQTSGELKKRIPYVVIPFDDYLELYKNQKKYKANYKNGNWK